MLFLAQVFKSNQCIDTEKAMFPARNQLQGESVTPDSFNNNNNEIME